MNTIENNRLIAEFMGLGKLNADISLYTIKNIAYPVNKLLYHSDWNCLMEVVEKIRKFHNGTEPLNDTQIGQLLQLIKKLNESLTLRNEVSIEAVYNACVEFIRWYNSNKS